MTDIECPNLAKERKEILEPHSTNFNAEIADPNWIFAKTLKDEPHLADDLKDKQLPKHVKLNSENPLPNLDVDLNDTDDPI
jgi:hypothetical protein